MGNGIADIFGFDFNKYIKYLKRNFRSLSEYEAEDIIQQTALKFIYKGNDLNAIDHLSAYIYRSLSNTAKDYFKKQSKEVLTNDFETRRVAQTQDYLLDSEMKQVVKKAIHDLDQKSKYVFVESVIKERSYKEISEETGEPIGTLLSRKSRAVKKLKRILDDYING